MKSNFFILIFMFFVACLEQKDGDLSYRVEWNKERVIPGSYKGSRLINLDFNKPHSYLREDQDCNAEKAIPDLGVRTVHLVEQGELFTQLLDLTGVSGLLQGPLVSQTLQGGLSR